MHDVKAGKGGLAVAFAAGLEGFELVEGLVELAVEVAFVAHNFLHIFGRWELAPVGEANNFLQLLLVGADDAHCCAVIEADGEIFPNGVQRVGHHRRLVAGDAVQAPDELGNALGVGGL